MSYDDRLESTENSTAKVESIDKSQENANRKIIHVDMDSFYASAELLRRPHLKGKPIAVGGAPTGRGVIATASYEARKFGVRSALSSRVAKRLCPDLVFIRPDFSYYKSLSQEIKDIFYDVTDQVQPLSLDEAYLDVTDVNGFDGSATLLARDIKDRIFSTTGLTASAGVAPNKFLAKVASEWKKPDGLFTISPAQVENFVRSLPVAAIPGVGKVSQRRLIDRGFITCGDLQNATLNELTSWFGRWGEYLYEVCRGIDNRRVKSRGARKSLSLERTYGEDLRDFSQIEPLIPGLFEQLKERLARAKTVDPIASQFVKIRFHDFQITTLEARFRGELNVDDFIKMFERAFLRRGEPVRLLGLGVRFRLPKTKRSRPGQLSLF